MCGLFGIVHTLTAADPALVERHTNLAAHRGPDGHGIYVDGNVGFGHRRLSIVELSELGAQPMRHARRNVCVIHNGEIYNHLELRRELQALGHEFRGQSDTEVILAAWLEWGRDCLARFNGMWAFAIHDAERAEVFVARDRFGVKPLYWMRTSDAVAFASEIRQLRPLLNSATCNEQLMRDYLATGLTDHTPATFVRGIEQLPGSHWLSIDTNSGRTTEGRWYTPGASQEASRLSPDQAAEALLALLKDSVRLRLRSDVPVGTCLSGGLDSSSIATLAAPLYREAAGRDFRAITAISTEHANNEEAYASIVVQRSRLSWIRITPTFEDFEATLENVIVGQEEPFGSPSVSMQWFVMREARRQGVTVLLDGQGGDEALLGYDRYYGAWARELVSHRGLGALPTAWRQLRAANDNMRPMRAAAYLSGSVFAPLRSASLKWRYPFLRHPRLPAAQRDFARTTKDAAAMQVHELTSTNLPMLLRYEDRNSMQHGIETRLPFLDYRIVEFALGLQAATKMREGWTKWPLRRAMDESMPREITWRRNKIGFEAPSRTWLGRLLPAIRSAVLASRFLQPYADQQRLQRMVNGVDDRMLWRLYNAHRWAELTGVA